MTDRDTTILDAAARLARERGYRNITRAMLADATGYSAGSISNFGRTSICNTTQPAGTDNMSRIRDALMARAVEDGDLDVIAQGLADRHPVALAAPVALRTTAIMSS